jgi:hypothetical protein
VRKLILFLILLCAIPVQAASYLDSRTDYYSALRTKFGVITSTSGYAGTTTCSLLFNEAVVAILPINQGIKRITKIVTSYKQDTYALDTTLIGIDYVRWTKADSVKSIEYLPASMWSRQAHKTTDGQDGYLKRPSFYDRTDSLIVLFPPPTNTTPDTIEIWGWHRHATADTDTLPTEIPERYRLSVLYHMCWNLAKARQDPRVALFSDELQWSLANIGLKMIGEAIVSDKK